MAKKGCLTLERRKICKDRIKRIEGQIRGLAKMVDEDRYCVDILQQISSVHEALRGLGKVLMQNYLEICATDALRSKDQKRQEEIYNEMMDVIYKFAK
ncbi:MAG: metal-sensitive transcriptional regulator [Acidobacteriota bacterium]